MLTKNQFSLLPHAKTLKACGMCVFETDLPCGVPWPESNIDFQSSLETLHLDNSFVDPEPDLGFEEFLRPLKNIRELRCHHVNADLPGDFRSEFCAGELIEIVAEACGQTIETLSLTSNENNTEAIRSFTAFDIS